MSPNFSRFPTLESPIPLFQCLTSDVYQMLLMCEQSLPLQLCNAHGDAGPNATVNAAARSGMSATNRAQCTCTSRRGHQGEPEMRPADGEEVADTKEIGDKGSEDDVSRHPLETWSEWYAFRGGGQPSAGAGRGREYLAKRQTV